jgi:thiamine-phosphate pyrophosphorylase
VSRSPLRGLYAITPDALCAEPAHLESAVSAALRGGARLLQLRDKSGDARRRRASADRLMALCRTQGAHLLINDDLDLAAALGCGVHLGASDAPLALARSKLGPHAVIGISCANSLPRALAAQSQGASYVAFGRFFASRTKPGAPQAGLDLLRQARTQLGIPLCAIGGVTPANAPSLLEAGADLVAAVEGVFGTGTDEGVEAAAAAYARLFDE